MKTGGHQAAAIYLSANGGYSCCALIVEMQLSTPVANNFGNSPITIGTINPGVIWAGTYFQVGAEAVFPVNHASGTGVGFLGQLHLYLDDMFPTTIGRPLLGGSSAPPQQLKF